MLCESRWLHVPNQERKEAQHPLILRPLAYLHYCFEDIQEARWWEVLEKQRIADPGSLQHLHLLLSLDLQLLHVAESAFQQLSV